MVRLIKESHDSNDYVCGPRRELQQFMSYVAQDFIDKNIIPTYEQVYDYIINDVWANSHIISNRTEQPNVYGYECLSIDSIYENIKNLCSFNLSDMYESYEGDRRWVSTDVEKPIAWKLKDYLRNNGIYFEPSSNGNLVHFEVKANAQEVRQINDFIDSLDYSYITQDMMKDDEY